MSTFFTRYSTDNHDRGQNIIEAVSWPVSTPSTCPLHFQFRTSMFFSCSAVSGTPAVAVPGVSVVSVGELSNQSCRLVPIFSQCRLPSFFFFFFCWWVVRAVLVVPKREAHKLWNLLRPHKLQVLRTYRNFKSTMQIETDPVSRPQGWNLPQGWTTGLPAPLR